MPHGTTADVVPCRREGPMEPPSSQTEDALSHHPCLPKKPSHHTQKGIEISSVTPGGVTLRHAFAAESNRMDMGCHPGLWKGMEELRWRPQEGYNIQRPSCHRHICGDLARTTQCPHCEGKQPTPWPPGAVRAACLRGPSQWFLALQEGRARREPHRHCHLRATQPSLLSCSWEAGVIVWVTLEFQFREWHEGQFSTIPLILELGNYVGCPDLLCYQLPRFLD